MSGRTRHLLDGELSIVGDLPQGPLLGVATVVSDFTFDRHGKHRRGAVFARALRDTGIAVYRFDAEGSGLAGASAEWSQRPWDSMTSQVCRARAAVARQHPSDTRNVLVAVGIGGVAAVLSAVHAPPDAMVLIGSDLVQDVRFVVTGLAGVRGGEQVLPSRVFRDRERLAPRDRLAELKIPVLCVNGSQDPRFQLADNDLSTYGAQVISVPDAADPFQSHCSTAATARIVRNWTAEVGVISRTP